MYDYLIVGAGLYGATFARLAMDKGFSCLVIDRRPHVGGNLYCENIEGITVHKYGPHVFHTSDREVWDFVNSIVPFYRYVNSPLAKGADGQLYNLPFNMNTFHQMWGVVTPREAWAKLEEQRSEALRKLDGSEPSNLEEQALALVGKDLFETIVAGYTEKQWGRKCKDLPAFIIRRLPVRLTYDNNYYNDPYQGIPVGGYNKLIEGLLRGAEVRVNEDFFDNREYWEQVSRKILFTGPIDRFYDYRFGKLEYRTVDFETEVLPVPDYQGNAVVNYSSAHVPYTRIIEHKHFENFGKKVFDNPKTVISREYPLECSEGREPYYPVNDAKNMQIYDRYQALASKEEKVLFGGRLAEYRYSDMGSIVREVLDVMK